MASASPSPRIRSASASARASSSSLCRRGLAFDAGFFGKSRAAIPFGNPFAFGPHPLVHGEPVSFGKIDPLDPQVDQFNPQAVGIRIRGDLALELFECLPCDFRKRTLSRRAPLDDCHVQQFGQLDFSQLDFQSRTGLLRLESCLGRFDRSQIPGRI